MTTATGIESIEKTIHKTNEWLKEIDEELDSLDRHFALQALRAVLHTLRDRLPVHEAANLGSQLPMLIRGIYYEGFHPKAMPIKDRRLEDFLERLRDGFSGWDLPDPERVARAVFKVLRRHISEGEIRDVIGNMPRAIQPLWGRMA